MTVRKSISRTIPTTTIDYSIIHKMEDGQVSLEQQPIIIAPGTLTEKEAMNFVGTACLINSLSYDNRKYSVPIKEFMELSINKKMEA